MKRNRLFPALLACVLLPGLVGHAASDMFLELSGIEGESADARHPKTIVIESFSWGMSYPSAAGGGGGGTGKVSFQDIHFTKILDKASPKLALACASGQHLQSAKLYVRSAAAEPVEYYVITLSDVMVTSVNVGGSSAGDRPTESLSLNFTKISWQYVPVLADGKPGTPVVTGWDVVNNVALP